MAKKNRDMQRIMRRIDSASSKSEKFDRRIIDRARKILDSTGTDGKRADAALSKLLGGEKRSNGWMNFSTGLGVRGVDKRMSAQVFWQPLEEVICEQLYGGDKIARRMVEMLPDDEFREWITLKGLDPDDMKAVLKRMDDLKVRDRFKLGRYWARLYGGAGTFINVDEGQGQTTQDHIITPLDLNKVRGIKSLWTFGRFELEVLAADVEYDLDNPNFGQPNLYMLVPRNRTDQSIQMQKQIIKFHHTRILRWNGAQLPRRIEITNRYWGDSVLSPFMDSLRDYKSGMGSVAHILQDFRTLVVSIKGLADAIASGNEAKVQARIDTMNISRSVLGAILLDAEEEEASYMSSTLTGVNELVEQLKSDVGSSQDSPKMKLFNEQTAGKLGAEDEKTRDWYDHVHASQESNVRPNLLRFFEILFAAKDEPLGGAGEPDEFALVFNSLWQQTDQEIAETRLKTAQADEVYMGAGVLHPDEVRTSRFGGDEYSAETTIDPNLSAAPPVDGEGDEGPDPEGLPSNLDPDTKMNPDPAMETPGTAVSPEAMAQAASTQSTPRASIQTKDQFGAEKAVNYVKNLYSTFIQDGVELHRLDGDAMLLQAVLVGKDLAKTQADAVKIARGIGGTMGYWRGTSQGFLFKRKNLRGVNLAAMTVKKPGMGLALFFGKPARIGELT